MTAIELLEKALIQFRCNLNPETILEEKQLIKEIQEFLNKQRGE